MPDKISRTRSAFFVNHFHVAMRRLVTSIDSKDLDITIIIHNIAIIISIINHQSMSQRVSLPFATLSRSTLRTSPISSPLLALRRAFHHPKLRRSPPPGSFVATRVAPRNAEWARNLATVGLGSGVGFLVYQAFAGRDGGSPFREASCECESLRIDPAVPGF